jgi:hypothetical protein
MRFMPSSRPQRIALLVLALLLLTLGIYELTPGQRLAAKQEALVEWAREGAPGDFVRTFAAVDYNDQWGHRAGDVAERVRSARFAYPALTIEAEKAEFRRAGDTAAVGQAITIRTGDGETHRHTFHFTWRRENLWPWSWKLHRVEAPGLEP